MILISIPLLNDVGGNIIAYLKTVTFGLLTRPRSVRYASYVQLTDLWAAIYELWASKLSHKYYPLKRIDWYQWRRVVSDIKRRWYQVVISIWYQVVISIWYQVVISIWYQTVISIWYQLSEPVISLNRCLYLSTNETSYHSYGGFDIQLISAAEPVISLNRRKSIRR